MSLYRCAACGSQKVMLDTQYNGVGYDYLRGAVGTVVLGVGGAAAGIKSQNTQVYKCTECGITLSYTMPEEIKLAIDIGVLDEKARSNLKLANGIPMYWDVLKNQFKNIEKGPADEAIEAREERQKAGLLSCATENKEEFDKAVDVVDAYTRKFTDFHGKRNPEEKRAMTIAEYMNFHHAVSVVIENVAKFFPRTNNDLFPGPFDKYRGLSYYRLKELFLIYLSDKVSHKGVFISDRSNSDFKNIKQTSSFVKSFINYIYPDGDRSSWGLIDEGARNGGFFERFYYKEVFGNNEELCRIVLPKYIENNGKVFFNVLSLEKVPYREQSELLKKDYFSVFPEKQQIYKKRLEEIKEGKTLQGKLKIESESLETKIEQNKKLIVSKENEAIVLKNKIFGKKKALEAAAALEADVQRLRMQIVEYNTKLKANEKQIKNLNASAAFKELVKEMDCFVVWRCEEGS